MSTTLRSSVPGPPALPVRYMLHRKGFPCLVLDTHAFGGQAGASARIENYLGFPTGISGQALAGRAYVQAQKFGAEMVVPVEVRSLDCTRFPSRSNWIVAYVISAKTVVIATGAKYRRPAIPELEKYEGRGVYYWASPIEAALCRQEEVVLVGGGNSAGTGNGIPGEPRGARASSDSRPRPGKKHVEISRRPHRVTRERYLAHGIRDRCNRRLRRRRERRSLAQSQKRQHADEVNPAHFPVRRGRSKHRVARQLRREIK